LNNSKNLRVDLILDDSSFKKCFKYFDSKGCNNEEIIDMVKISEVFETGEEGQSPFSKKIFKKYLEKNDNEKIKNFEGVQILDQKFLFEKLENIIDFWNNWLKEEGINKYEDLFKEKAITILKMKIWDDFQKFRVYKLFENLQAENLEISLKNSFETHGFF